MLLPRVCLSVRSSQVGILSSHLSMSSFNYVSWYHVFWRQCQKKSLWNFSGLP